MKSQFSVKVASTWRELCSSAKQQTAHAQPTVLTEQDWEIFPSKSLSARGHRVQLKRLVVKHCLHFTSKVCRRMRFKVFSRVWATYQRYLSTNPWRTQTLTTGMIILHNFFHIAEFASMMQSIVLIRSSLL